MRGIARRPRPGLADGMAQGGFKLVAAPAVRGKGDVTGREHRHVQDGTIARAVVRPWAIVALIHGGRVKHDRDLNRSFMAKGDGRERLAANAVSVMGDGEY